LSLQGRPDFPGELCDLMGAAFTSIVICMDEDMVIAM
jgi:hypothetical protein